MSINGSARKLLCSFRLPLCGRTVRQILALYGKPAPEMAGARVRLHGKLTRKWVLDGLELVLNSKTRIKKSAGTGNYVRVREHVAGDGQTIIVDQIQVR